MTLLCRLRGHKEPFGPKYDFDTMKAVWTCERCHATVTVPVKYEGGGYSCFRPWGQAETLRDRRRPVQ